MSLNPRDGTTLAYMAIMIAFSALGARGALAQRAIELNRHHPAGITRLISHHYRQTRLRGSLANRQEDQHAGFPLEHLTAAAGVRHAGRHEELARH